MTGEVITLITLGIIAAGIKEGIREAKKKKRPRRRRNYKIKPKKPKEPRNNNYQEIENYYYYNYYKPKNPKIEKGQNYEEFIADIYRDRGYHVIEHGKIMGRKDGGIDLIATKEDETILIQCKNWKESGRWRIRQHHIKALRTDARDFIEKHPEFKKPKLKARFVLSGRILDKGAWRYLKETENIVDYEIIRPLPLGY